MHTSDYIKKLSEKCFLELQSTERCAFDVHGENTHFVRLNQALIRQSTQIIQNEVHVDFYSGNKTHNFSFFTTGDLETDQKQFSNLLADSRARVKYLPEDPYQVPLTNGPGINLVEEQQLPDSNKVLSEILDIASDKLDLAGIFCHGDVSKIQANSLGQFHSFSTQNFYLDYSIYTPNQRATKSMLASKVWDEDTKKRFQSDLNHRRTEIELLSKDKKKLKPGKYKTYLAPAAHNELLSMLGWGGSSYAAYKQGRNPLNHLINKNKHFSEKFTLVEDFSLGLVPKFNSIGEVSKEQITLIDKGRYQELLVSSRSASEYDVVSNAADMNESLRSPHLLEGDIDVENILNEIGTGLYISHLWYTNWSNLIEGKLTGMTRNACFWVEDGKLVSPIEDMRFDDDLFSLWGEQLLGLTKQKELIVSTDSYFRRGIGGALLPGALIGEMRYTL